MARTLIAEVRRRRDIEIRALTACPVCHAGKRYPCPRRALSHPERAALGEAIRREAFLRRIGVDPAGRGGMRSAWQAAREWDREEAETLRAWLSTWGPILWKEATR